MRAKDRRGRLLGAIVGTFVAATVGSAAAQSYPSRTITLVVPFPAGGPLDTGARVMAERMRVSLGQPVIIENVAGASGSIGVGRVARAAPDGYTLVVGGTPTHVMNGAVMTLPYDVINDFAPIALTTNAPSLIAARKSMPANRPQGTDRVAEGQPGQGRARHRRRRHHLAHRRRVLPAVDRHALHAGALSRRRTGGAGPRRRPDRPDDRSRQQHDVVCARRHASRPTRSPPRPAWRRSPTCRPWTKPACRAFTC